MTGIVTAHASSVVSRCGFADHFRPNTTHLHGSPEQYKSVRDAAHPKLHMEAPL